MRRLVLASVAAMTVLIAGWLLPSPSAATPLSTGAGLGAAIADISLMEQSACRVWWNGWRWVRRCWWGGPYWGYRRWGWRRWGWRRWGWHRWGWRRSDIELKQDIVRVGTLDNGLGIYRFTYKGEDQTAYVGVLAQEVQTVMPRAVARASDGHLSVDYSRLGFHFMRWDEWQAQNEASSAR